MSIPIKREPNDLVRKIFGIVETCTFCPRPTKYWHEATNKPVCPKCSTVHKVSELVNQLKHDNQ